MKKFYCLLLLLGLTACGTSTPPPTVAMDLKAPVVQLQYEAQVQQMNRNDVIQAVHDCEGNGLRATMVTSKRIVAGVLSNIIIDVQCVPRFRAFF
jgi:hypothetical protein